MIVRLGNLTVEQFERRVGVDLNADDKEWFDMHRQDNATVSTPDKLHIFDKPFGIQCGSEVIHEAMKRLRAYGSENFNERFAVYD